MMNKIRFTKNAVHFVLLAAVIFAVIFYGKECSKGALKGIYFCAEVLVPSIFPFMIISVFIVKSGFSEKKAAISLNPGEAHTFYVELEKVERR